MSADLFTFWFRSTLGAYITNLYLLQLGWLITTHLCKLGLVPRPQDWSGAELDSHPRALPPRTTRI